MRNEGREVRKVAHIIGYCRLFKVFVLMSVYWEDSRKFEPDLHFQQITQTTQNSGDHTDHTE